MGSRERPVEPVEPEPVDPVRRCSMHPTAVGARPGDGGQRWKAGVVEEGIRIQVSKRRRSDRVRSGVLAKMSGGVRWTLETGEAFQNK